LNTASTAGSANPAGLRLITLLVFEVFFMAPVMQRFVIARLLAVGMPGSDEWESSMP
jgi:hypothetical protein